MDALESRISEGLERLADQLPPSEGGWAEQLRRQARLRTIRRRIAPTAVAASVLAIAAGAVATLVAGDGPTPLPGRINAASQQVIGPVKAAQYTNGVPVSVWAYVERSTVDGVLTDRLCGEAQVGRSRPSNLASKCQSHVVADRGAAKIQTVAVQACDVSRLDPAQCARDGGLLVIATAPEVRTVRVAGAGHSVTATALGRTDVVGLWAADFSERKLTKSIADQILTVRAMNANGELIGTVSSTPKNGYLDEDPEDTRVPDDATRRERAREAAMMAEKDPNYIPCFNSNGYLAWSAYLDRIDTNQEPMTADERDEHCRNELGLRGVTRFYPQ